MDDSKYRLLSNSSCFFLVVSIPGDRFKSDNSIVTRFSILHSVLTPTMVSYTKCVCVHTIQ